MIASGLVNPEDMQPAPHLRNRQHAIHLRDAATIGGRVGRYEKGHFGLR